MNVNDLLTIKLCHYMSNIRLVWRYKQVVGGVEEGGTNSFKLWEINYSGWLHRQIEEGQACRNLPFLQKSGGAPLIVNFHNAIFKYISSFIAYTAKNLDNDFKNKVMCTACINKTVFSRLSVKGGSIVALCNEIIMCVSWENVKVFLSFTNKMHRSTTLLFNTMIQVE